MSEHESLTARLTNEKIREQRDTLRDALNDIRDGPLTDWRAGEIDAETAMEGVRDALEGLPWFTR